MKNGFKLFGFLLGVVSGGIFTLFTAPRKGAELRKDVMKTMKEKGSVTQVLLDEIKAMGMEAKKTAQQINSSELVEEYKDIAKEKFDALYADAKIKMKDAMGAFEEEWEALREQVEVKEQQVEKLKEKVNSSKK